jgi:hypothetical protein
MSLATIFESVKTALSTAKDAGSLDAVKFMKTAMEMIVKISSLSQFSDSEKDAVIQYFLKKALEHVGGLGGPEVEKHLVSAVLTASHALRPLLPSSKLLSLLYCTCTQALDQADIATVKEAVEKLSSTQESGTPVLQVRQVESVPRTPLASIPETEPTPLASH